MKAVAPIASVDLGEVADVEVLRVAVAVVVDLAERRD
jgi:hypothetical protein